MQQQQGGPQYGFPPEMPQPFAGTGAVRTHAMGIPGSDTATLAEAASPISSCSPATARGSFDEMMAAQPGTSGFPDEDAGEEAERGQRGNRWPRQETLALLKIRSEMDAAFRDATLKGLLWEDVSRKLAELGYHRSAKKCKEKFENVHKYYKRTKGGRAGRQDGKNYRFFSQLEALNTSISPNTSTSTAAPAAVAPMTINLTAVPIPVCASNPIAGSSGRIAPATRAPVSAFPAVTTSQINLAPPIGPELAGPSIYGAGPSSTAAVISFSSSSSESESEDDIEGGGSKDTKKRKRSGSSSGGNRKMMAFFEVLMKHVMEKQEAMQQRFLETLEKREHERMMREDAWRRQEMVRITHEQEIMTQERAMSASRDAAVIAFLQKITGQTVPIASPAIMIPGPPPPQSTPLPPQPQTETQSPTQQQQQLQQASQPPQQSRSADVDVAVTQQEEAKQQEAGGSGSFDATLSRWPKAEVLALINLRSGLEYRYQESGPKGPLWEEISAGMQRLGYNRNAKRCKEKWDNINKYFKKVKESNKKRPQDAKTCPYFHQLDALYRRKALGSSSFNTPSKQEQDTDTNANPNPTPNPQEKTGVLAIMPPPPRQQQQQQHSEVSKKARNTDTSGSSAQVQTSNGGLPPCFFEGAAKKPEDIVKELMGHHHPPKSEMTSYNKLNEPDSDTLDQEEEDYDEEEDDYEESSVLGMQYKAQFQWQNVAPDKGERSFLAMVQ